ncbi:MAG: tetratricopeptide repeat protein [Desulfurivibrio sp.]|nr:tetratricopeptide repeat protein [Desulfurivibrio sp.]
MTAQGNQSSPPAADGKSPATAGDTRLVRRDTMFFTAFACLVIGFVGGIVFSVYNLADSAATPGGAGPTQQEITPEQSRVMESLQREVAADPDNLQAWTQLGHLYFDTDQHGKAIEAYRRSLELEPDNPDVLTDLGVMYRRNGQPTKAVEVFNKAIALHPEHETARFNLGVVLLHDLDKRQQALAAWRELVALNPVAYAPNGQLVSELVRELEAEVE